MPVVFRHKGFRFYFFDEDISVEGLLSGRSDQTRPPSKNQAA